MYSLFRPSPARIRDLVASEARKPVFPTGAKLPRPAPAGFRENHARSRLGHGAKVFQAARAAIQRWQQFPSDWISLEPEDAPVQVGTTVAIVVRHLGVWTANCCRITHLTDNEHTFAFTYATTAGHAMEGAETFTIRQHVDGTVEYEIYSISRPRDSIARLARPIIRGLQRRFAQDSPLSLRHAISSP
jgi:uncharacterized protein (UPF0548 family)